MLCNLHRNPLGNVQDELNIRIVVVVAPSRHRDIVVCHLDIFCICLSKKNKQTNTNEEQEILESHHRLFGFCSRQ